MTDETILAGAEPFFLKGNDIGVLLCHGFTGTTQSMRYLGEQLHGAGYTVIGPRLKGHGISPQAMAKTTAGDWIDSVDEALVAERLDAARGLLHEEDLVGPLPGWRRSALASVGS